MKKQYKILADSRPEKLEKEINNEVSRWTAPLMKIRMSSSLQPPA